MSNGYNTKKSKALETNLEVAKALAASGINLEQIAARSATWAMIGEIIGDELYVHGITADRLGDETIVEIAQQAAERLKAKANLNREWKSIVYQVIYDNPIADLLTENNELQPLFDVDRDDEGLLTEQYENATRCMDDEGYWPDGGASASWDSD